MDESIDSIATTLLRGVQEGENGAWSRFVQLYSPWVYYWCRKRGLQPIDAEDVGQEVFVAVSRKVEDFRRGGEGHTFRGWLHTITSNKVKDFWRKDGNSPGGQGGATAQKVIDQIEEPPEQADVAKETRMWFQQVLEMVRQNFSESSYLAFVKYVIEEHDASATAQDLGITRNQVFLAKSRILKWLRDNLGDDIAGVLPK
ncbi:MAG: sigma-70 family RNA polymerase sigma factor [Planctomycetes bacterium]|nr:sigma-70 family RNA polymerase sigma factor [Planctomycetota bacterium]